MPSKPGRQAWIFTKLRSGSIGLLPVLEVVQITAEPSGMRQHLTDHHLEMARLLLSQSCPEDARPHIPEGARLIGEAGYHQQGRELAAAQAAL